MKKWASLAIAAAFVLGPMSARADIKALEEAAKKEGELTWYVSHYTSEGAEELGATFTKLAPARVAGFMMGVWFLSTSIGDYIGGRMASLYESWTLPSLFGASLDTAALQGADLLPDGRLGQAGYPGQFGPRAGPALADVLQQELLVHRPDQRGPRREQGRAGVLGRRQGRGRLRGTRGQGRLRRGGHGHLLRHGARDIRARSPDTRLP